ncbi:MAG: polysaccharide biosynthesis/export family protein [Opitutaceae bacterium]|nr:polysaccharide biosynthesis/export family protein [Cytophagales bacterium]
MSVRNFYVNLLLIGFLALLASCGSVNQNIMFRTKGQIISDPQLDALSKAERNYVIKKDDYLQISVYTNKGERLVDPNQEMSKQLGAGMEGSSKSNEIKYLVESTGEVKLPLLGRLKIEGNSLRQLDSILQIKYSEFYEDAFITSKIVNKRVFVLGNTGNKSEMAGKVVMLENENMNVIEVLTIAGGLDQVAKSYNIRLIRGDLKNPNVYLIDLSTMEGVRMSQLNVQPNDIIYVERQRRVLNQILSEVGPLIAFVNTLLLVYIATKTRL